MIAGFAGDTHLCSRQSRERIEARDARLREHDG